MAIIVKGLEQIEVPDTDLRVQAHNALQKAAERIGMGKVCIALSGDVGSL